MIPVVFGRILLFGRCCDSDPYRSDPRKNMKTGPKALFIPIKRSS